MSAIDAFHDAVKDSYLESLRPRFIPKGAAHRSREDENRLFLQAQFAAEGGFTDHLYLSAEDIDKMVHGPELDRLYQEAATVIVSHPLKEQAMQALDDVHRDYLDYWRLLALHQGSIPPPEKLDYYCAALDGELEELRKYRSISAAPAESQADRAPVKDVQFTESEKEIIAAIRAAGRRLVTEQVIAAIGERNNGVEPSLGSTKINLATLVRYHVLTNATDSHGKGYGLTEWTES